MSARRCFFLHRWSLWEPYLWRGVTYEGNALLQGMYEPIPVEVTENREKRRCERCGKSQDRRVR